MTKQELTQQFVSCVEHMPDALLIDPDDPKFTWKISYNSAEHVVENFPPFWKHVSRRRYARRAMVSLMARQIGR